ncbi:MAG TPA: D-alanyl-D-alanine carboxypeptidase/D-alanyl-D-alanine-endopeptidase [Gemmatimonadaceae bacterium]|jgi:D-alanyl-D-alanine carboxypeptidase/D-alanyl-D-alanine-endopeptidase (penicillin-binding protein 4)
MIRRAASRLIAFSIVEIFFAACASSGVLHPAGRGGGQRAALRGAIDSMADAPEFHNAFWGILIVDPERGDTLYSRNAGKLFLPASNMKVVTSSVALEQLGADFTYRTTLLARGALRDSTITGDVAVIGRGDPTVSDHMWIDAMIPLRAMADSLAARGVKHITGRLVAMGNAFPGPVLGYGWSWEDLESSYSAAIDELLFNEGFSEIRLHGGERPGDSVRVEVRPAHTFPALRADLTTIAAPSCVAGDSTVTTPCPVTPPRFARRRELSIHKDTLRGDVVVSGGVVAGDSVTLEVTHRDPDLAYLAALTEALRDRGIRVDSAPAVNADTAMVTGDTLVTFFSKPLREILPALLKPSQNQIAEVLLRTIGLERGGSGTADSGRKVVERQLAAWGVPANTYVIRDGSGLSRYDYLAPEALVHILDVMRRSPNFQLFYDALPIAGVDGTIKTRMRGTPAANNVHAKTGSVANARSLSGYVRTAGGRVLIFSMLANNWTVSAGDVTRMQDSIAARLAALPLR